MSYPKVLTLATADVVELPYSGQAWFHYETVIVNVIALNVVH